MNPILNKPRFSIKSIISFFSAALLIGIWGCNKTTTAPANNDLITLTSPSGGETFKVGDVVSVKWSVKADPPDYPEVISTVDVQLSIDSAVTWGFLRSGSITKEGNPEWGDFKWTVKDTILAGGIRKATKGSKKCLLRVLEYSTSDKRKISTMTKTFSISE